MFKPSRKLSIVIPVYNERVTVKETLERVIAAPLPVDWDREIIIVDDGSTDGTREELKKIGHKARIILRDKNGGKGAALKEGFKAAMGDYILIQDADAEYDPSDYSGLLKPIIDNKTEVVFGSRMLGKNSVPLNRIYFYGGLMVTKIFNLLFGTNLTDVATCYKIFPQKFAQGLVGLPSNDFVFDVVELSFFLLRNSKKINEVPIKYDSRDKGEGKKLNWRHGWRCLKRMASLFIAEKWNRTRSL